MNTSQKDKSSRILMRRPSAVKRVADLLEELTSHSEDATREDTRNSYRSMARENTLDEVSAENEFVSTWDRAVGRLRSQRRKPFIPNSASVSALKLPDSTQAFEKTPGKETKSLRGSFSETKLRSTRQTKDAPHTTRAIRRSTETLTANTMLNDEIAKKNLTRREKGNTRASTLGNLTGTTKRHLLFNSENQKSPYDHSDILGNTTIKIPDWLASNDAYIQLGHSASLSEEDQTEQNLRGIKEKNRTKSLHRTLSPKDGKDLSNSNYNKSQLLKQINPTNKDTKQTENLSSIQNELPPTIDIPSRWQQRRRSSFTGALVPVVSPPSDRSDVIRAAKKKYTAEDVSSDDEVIIASKTRRRQIRQTEAELNFEKDELKLQEMYVVSARSYGMKHQRTHDAKKLLLQCYIAQRKLADATELTGAPDAHVVMLEEKLQAMHSHAVTTKTADTHRTKNTVDDGSLLELTLRMESSTLSPFKIRGESNEARKRAEKLKLTAESFLERGFFVAAAKALTRANELNPLDTSIQGLHTACIDMMTARPTKDDFDVSVILTIQNNNNLLVLGEPLSVKFTYTHASCLQQSEASQTRSNMDTRMEKSNTSNLTLTSQLKVDTNMDTYTKRPHGTLDWIGVFRVLEQKK